MNDPTAAVNIADKFSKFDDYWHPRIVGALNGQHVKIAKIKGEFDWHFHENEDELFLVVQGTLQMHLRDRVVLINPGEFYIVPRGVEHRPVADDEVHMMMFEPETTSNTGNIITERTRHTLNWI